MNDDSHFLMSLGAEMSSTKRDYYAQRCREIADAIEQLHTDVAEWKQAASVEANLRREFLNRAEKAEAALPLVGVERREDVARLLMNTELQFYFSGAMLRIHPSDAYKLADAVLALPAQSGSGVERTEEVAPWPLDGPIAAFCAAWPSCTEWWTSLDNGYGRKFTIQDIPPEPFEAFAAALSAQSGSAAREDVARAIYEGLGGLHWTDITDTPYASYPTQSMYLKAADAVLALLPKHPGQPQEGATMPLQEFQAVQDACERFRSALTICAAPFTQDAEDDAAPFGELCRRMQVAFNALNEPKLLFEAQR